MVFNSVTFGFWLKPPPTKQLRLWFQVDSGPWNHVDITGTSTNSYNFYFYKGPITNGHQVTVKLIASRTVATSQSDPNGYPSPQVVFSAQHS